MGDAQALIEMGFEREKVEYAMKVTDYKGIEPAMEWLLAHADEPLPSSTIESGASIGSTGSEESPSVSTSSQTNTTTASVAKSLKCDECGKLCKDQSEVEFHAAKTGHSNFSESTEEKKPLTEEERQAQVELLNERLKQKRRERAEREKADEVERERNRIRSGKDMTEARRRLEEIEMKKIIDQRKREKEEEKFARERVRAQIESDKAARRAGSQNADVKPSVTSTTPNAGMSSQTSIKSPTKEYTETRIQIRLQDGSTLTETFNVKEQLSAVRVFIQMKTGTDHPFGLMTSFPRKVFNDEDMEKPLEILGLVPSAVLIMTKAAL